MKVDDDNDGFGNFEQNSLNGFKQPAKQEPLPAEDDGFGDFGNFEQSAPESQPVDDDFGNFEENTPV
jgi:hypothetical protein